jgi:hypothetical protein
MEVFEVVETVKGQTIFAVFFQNSDGVKSPRGYMVNKGGRRFLSLDLAREDANLISLESARQKQPVDSGDSDARSQFGPKR